MDKAFIEIGTESRCKHGQTVSGDTFLFRKIKEEGRIVAVLSDGLGSGIKASVLSTLTATMAIKYVENHMDIEKAASVIMKTLPVCKDRRISYATFTIIDIQSNNEVDVVEYDNPSLLHFCGSEFCPVEKEMISINHGKRKSAKIYLSKIKPQCGDRLIFHSDGLNQSGMGKRSTPLGWGVEGVKRYVSDLISKEADVSARKLARMLVDKANDNDGYRCGDDTTCSVIYFRQPRQLMIASGPPVEQTSDIEYGMIFRDFKGTRVICGGTTAKILARELDKRVQVDIRQLSPDVPPVSIMEGINLVTEGIITMTRTLQYLEAPNLPELSVTNAALTLANTLLNHDEITFLVGTKLNEANQMIGDSSVETRYTIVKKLASVLENRYLKHIYIIVK